MNAIQLIIAALKENRKQYSFVRVVEALSNTNVQEPRLEDLILAATLIAAEIDKRLLPLKPDE